MSCAARERATSSWKSPLPPSSLASARLHLAAVVTRQGWEPLGSLIVKLSLTMGIMDVPYEVLPEAAVPVARCDKTSIS